MEPQPRLPKSPNQNSSLDSTGGQCRARARYRESHPALIETIVRVTDKVPSLRVVLDHLPSCNPPAPRAARSAYNRNLRELAARPQVYVKVSQVLRRVEGRVARELALYRPRLDELWDLFERTDLSMAATGTAIPSRRMT